MESKKSSRLPEGVGRKIVEALKKQSQAVSEAPQDETYALNEVEETGFQQPQLSLEETKPESSYWDNEEISYEPVAFEESDFSIEPETKAKEESFGNQISSYNETSFGEQSYYEEPEKVRTRQAFTESKAEEVLPIRPLNRTSVESRPLPERIVPRKDHEPINLELSTNVEVLKRLIVQLPSGVTRQTGAQIIRTTMEAMGVSMNKVLSEAQAAQDDLQQSIRDTMNTIEEYRNNIRILEKEAQCYRKQSDELEDLISLFILSEKEDE